MKNKTMIGARAFARRNSIKMATVGAAVLATASAHATDTSDIGSVITTITGYKTDAIVVGVAILLFVLGRRVVRKLI